MKSAAPLRFAVGLGCLLAVAVARAQNPPACEPKIWTTAEDHQDMMGQLGIKALRPGPSGNEQQPNHANYDEALANPFPNLPDVLTLKNGQKVTTAAMWAARRKEIVEDFDREVVGRIPPNVPKVTWSVAERAAGTIGGLPVVGRQLIGHVDNAACPSISVDIQLTLVVPADTNAPVPVMIMFRGGSLGQALGTAPPQAGRGGFTPPPGALGTDPPATEQLIAAGWGFAFLNPASIQADNGAGLTKGIIGLVNKGQPRKPDDWGSLRAWAWGASRALDYLETDPAVDAKQVGIEGVSRFGKAALVTMAFEQRFAVVLVGSSGEGGAKLHRRNFGEAVENLTGSGEYHWMAGNFLKYGASEAAFGSKNAGDMPVDAHELIALCAPRLTFISYGVPEKGDAKWLDQQGSYMAAVAAGPVFRLLGAKDLGTADDYRKAKMPASERRAARRPAGLAPARRRPHRRPELEVLHPVGRHVLRPHPTGEDRAGGPALRALRPELAGCARAAGREGKGRWHRCLLRRRFDHAPLGCARLPGTAGELEAELLRLERRQLRVGRRPDAEHPVAARSRRAGRASIRR